MPLYQKPEDPHAFVDLRKRVDELERQLHKVATKGGVTMPRMGATGPASTAVPNPYEGQVVLDNNTRKPYYFENGEWHPFSSPAVGSLPKLYPSPGQLVKPWPRFDPDLSTSTGVTFTANEFPGGVIVAAASQILDDDAPLNGGPSKFAGLAPSWEGKYFEQAGDTWDDVDACLTFRPVEDLGCIPGVVYGMWISWNIVTYTQGVATSEAMSGTPHIEAMSDHTDDANRGSLGTGGYRFPNATDGPTEVIESGNMAVYPCWAMAPFGGYDNYGDFPQQGGDWNAGVSFRAGETITVKAWMQNPDSSPRHELIGIDHLVFMPYVADKLDDDIIGNFPNESKNFVSTALEVWGYNGDSATYAEVEDGAGQIYGPGSELVEDTQSLRWAFDPAGGFTIAFYDELASTGLFTKDRGGTTYLYVLCRQVDVSKMDIGQSVSGSVGARHQGGHVTPFYGSMPLADIYCDEGNGWCFAYAGEMPIGWNILDEVGIMAWIADDTIMEQGNVTSVRLSTVAFVPKQAYIDKTVRTDVIT